VSSGPVADLKVQLDIESAKFRAELEKVTKSIDGVADKLDKVSKKSSATEVFKGIAAWNGFKKVQEGVKDFLLDGIKGLIDEEQASLRLSSALTNLGYNANRLLGPLEAQQRMFERTTMAQGEQVAQMQQLMLQYGVAPKDIERTTRAVLDYSAATGADALSSTTALLQAVNEHKDGVKGLGVTYVSTGDAATDLGLAVDQLETKFKGSAEAATSGLAGDVDGLKKSMDEAAKSFAEFLAQLDKKIGAVKLLADAFKGLRIAMGGATPEEEQYRRQQRIEALVEERNKAEADYTSDTTGIMSYVRDPERAKQQRDERVAKANAEILQLQHESAAYLKESGRTHSNTFEGVVNGDTPITDGQSKKAKGISNAKGFASVEVHAAKLSKAIDAVTIGPAEFLTARKERFRNEGAQLTQDVRTPLEEYRDEVKHLDELWNAGTISAETYNRALKNSTTRYKQATDAADETGHALARLGSTGLGFLGKLGGVIGAGSGQVAKDATQVAQSAGAGSAAGPIGAVVGVLVAILSESKSVMQLISLASEVVQGLADALGPIIDPVNRVVAALIPFGEALGKMLAPLGMIVDAVLRPFAPVLLVLGSLLEGLTPLFQMLITAITPLVLLIELPAELALFALFYAIKFLGLGLLELAGFIGPFWNGVVSAITGAFKSLADFEIAGAKPFGFLNDWADTLNKGIINTDEVEKQKKDLAALDWESAQAKSDEIAATKNVADAADQAANALFNLPAGYKIAAATFAAATALDGMEIPAHASGTVATRAQLALIGEGGEPEVVAPESMLRRVIREERGGGDVRLQVYLDGRQIHAHVKRIDAADRFNATGEIVGAF
jgi:hypothetical protein